MTTRVRRPSADELLAEAALLSADDLERLVREVLALRADRIAPHVETEESRLLEEINAGVPEELTRRYRELSRRRRAERLTSQEYDELIRLGDTVEQYEVVRVQRLMELARLRRMSLPQLLKSLRIPPPRA